MARPSQGHNYLQKLGFLQNGRFVASCNYMDF
jgi:hypothetical protein